MSGDHRSCDELFASAEQAVADAAWSEAGASFEAFERAMDRHFAMEESVLFPKFEQRTGNTMGPTQVMRMEHTQIRDLLAQMREAAREQDADEYLGVSETLLIMMQQHNVKEEQILYPMTDDVLNADGIVAELERI